MVLKRILVESICLKFYVVFYTFTANNFHQLDVIITILSCHTKSREVLAPSFVKHCYLAFICKNSVTVFIYNVHQCTCMCTSMQVTIFIKSIGNYNLQINTCHNLLSLKVKKFENWQEKSGNLNIDQKFREFHSLIWVATLIFCCKYANDFKFV